MEPADPCLQTRKQRRQTFLEMGEGHREAAVATVCAALGLYIKSVTMVVLHGCGGR